MFELTLALSERFKMTPFDIFREECGEVISVINHFLDKGNEEHPKPAPAVYDGFWDF